MGSLIHFEVVIFQVFRAGGRNFKVWLWKASSGYLEGRTPSLFLLLI